MSPAGRSSPTRPRRPKARAQPTPPRGPGSPAALRGFRGPPALSARIDRTTMAAARRYRLVAAWAIGQVVAGSLLIFVAALAALAVAGGHRLARARGVAIAVRSRGHRGDLARGHSRRRDRAQRPDAALAP